MVINRNRQNTLCLLLANHILVQDLINFFWDRQLCAVAISRGFLDFFANDVVAQIDALVTDEHRGPCNQFSHFVLAFATEGAIQQLATIA